MDIDQLLEEFPAEDAIATAEQDAIVSHDGPSCEKCNAPITGHDALVCRQCGWYASIGSFVEIDKSWEVATDPELATEEDAQPKPKAKLPTWAWILTGCLVTVLAESVAARFLTPAGLGTRTLWSLTQLFLGFVAFMICHTYCFALVLKHDADVKLLDYILRPIKSWSIIFRGMPERGWVCYLGMSGLFAAALSMLIIGAIPYERLLDWNVKEKAKFNLMGAIMDQAKNVAAEDEKSLEEAIGDFAGKAELDEDGKKKPNPKNNREKEDCIIIGYMANQAGQIHTVFLAAERYAKLSYAGSAKLTDLPEEELLTLTKKLAAIRTHKPFVRVSIDGATWVKPQQLCRVSYRRRGKQGGLYGARLEELLGEVNLSKP